MSLLLAGARKTVPAAELERCRHGVQAWSLSDHSRKYLTSPKSLGFCPKSLLVSEEAAGKASGMGCMCGHVGVLLEHTRAWLPLPVLMQLASSGAELLPFSRPR